MFRILALTTVLALVSFGTFAEEGKQPDNTAVTPAQDDKADNSRRNKRETDPNELNPVDQKENSADLAVSQKIRRAIYDDNTLSLNAHNVKIITRDGIVNLKGPVHSQDEKTNVEAKAAAVVGKDNVKSQLEIAAQ